MTVTFTSCRDGDSAPPSSNTPQPDTVATCRSRVNRDRVNNVKVNKYRVNSDRITGDWVLTVLGRTVIAILVIRFQN